MSKDHEASQKEHQRAMQTVQQEVRQAVAQAREKRGVIVYLYGNGKGKSSSGLGTLLRAVGHGQRAAIVQFIKGKWKTGETLFFKEHPLVQHHIMGSGFTWDSQNREADIAAAKLTWNKVESVLADETINLVLLDEITYMFDFAYLPLAPLVQALNNRPKMQNVILTGRSAIAELIELADTVSEIREIKHAFNAGIKAQKGIEF